MPTRPRPGVTPLGVAFFGADSRAVAVSISGVCLSLLIVSRGAEAEQQAAAIASKEKLEKSGRFNRPIVTQIEPASTFWRAEEYHQRYLQKRGQSHCAV